MPKRRKKKEEKEDLTLRIALRRAAGKITKRREANKDLPQPHFTVHQLVIEEKKKPKVDVVDIVLIYNKEIIDNKMKKEAAKGEKKKRRIHDVHKTSKAQQHNNKKKWTPFKHRRLKN